jgi:hypothetical protein
MTMGGVKAMGATYCNNLYNDDKRCSITLCNEGIVPRSMNRQRGLHAFQGRNTDFSKAKGDVEEGPVIDHWNLLEIIILHEVRCTAL